MLFIGGDGKAEFSPKGAEVTAKVVGDVLGDKIRIGKYKPKTGYKRHTGHRSQLTEIEITSIGLKAAPKSTAKRRRRLRRGEGRSRPRRPSRPRSRRRRSQEGACEEGRRAKKEDA